MGRRITRQRGAKATKQKLTGILVLMTKPNPKVRTGEPAEKWVDKSEEAKYQAEGWHGTHVEYVG